jgi:hypothetical protein
VFLLDDILLSPVKALMAIGRHVEETAHRNLEDQEKDIVASLAKLHQMLESGAIGDEDFNTRENKLLDQLEAIQEILNPVHEPEEEECHGKVPGTD